MNRKTPKSEKKKPFLPSTTEENCLELASKTSSIENKTSRNFNIFFCTVSKLKKHSRFSNICNAVIKLQYILTLQNLRLNYKKARTHSAYIFFLPPRPFLSVTPLLVFHGANK